MRCVWRDPEAAWRAFSRAAVTGARAADVVAGVVVGAGARGRLWAAAGFARRVSGARRGHVTVRGDVLRPHGGGPPSGRAVADAASPRAARHLLSLP